MKFVSSILTTFVLTLALALTALPAYADDMAKLEGKWSVKKTNDEGQSYTQFIEITKGKFKFRIAGNDGQTVLYAEGDIKLSKAGAFSAIQFYNIKAGPSADQTELVDDDRDAIYLLAGDTWTLATNFDRYRENQKPAADAYVRVRN